MPGAPGRGGRHALAVSVDGSPLPNEATAHLLEVTVDQDVSVPESLRRCAWRKPTI